MSDLINEPSTEREVLIPAMTMILLDAFLPKEKAHRFHQDISGIQENVTGYLGSPPFKSYLFFT